MSLLRDSYIKITNDPIITTTFEESLSALSLKYVAESNQDGVLDTASYDIIVRTKEKKVLLLGFFIEFNEARIEFSIIEGVTSTGGNALSPPPFNVNRETVPIPEIDLDMEENPASVSGGTVLYGPSPGFGSPGQGNSGGAGSLTSADDFIWLKSNTVYAFRTTNQSGVAVDLSVSIKIAESPAFEF